MSDKIEAAIDRVCEAFRQRNEAEKARLVVSEPGMTEEQQATLQYSYTIPAKLLHHGSRIRISSSGEFRSATEAAIADTNVQARAAIWRNQYASATSWKMDAIRSIFGSYLSSAYYADYLKLQELCQGKPRRDHRRYGHGLLRRTITLLLAADRKDRYWFNVAADVLWLLGDRSKRGRKLAVKAKATELLTDLKECLAQNRPPPSPPSMMLMDMASFENIQAAMSGS